MNLKVIKNKLAVLSSVFVFAAGVWTVSGVPVMAEPKSAEENDPANSWRYKDGKPVRQQQTAGPSIYSRGARTVTNAWNNVNGVFLNSLGNPIPNATAKGIDVSKWDGKIDWKKVKEDGIDYAIIRAGYGENLKSQDDPTWEYNSSECERIGMPYGVYIYSYATNTAKAKSEAEHVMRLIKGKKLSYPIYYDMEDEKYQGGLSNKELGDIADTFIKTLNNAGYKNVGVYANKYWFSSLLTSSVFNKNPRWVAQYNYRCDYNGNYHMWQSTDLGKVSGIGTNVDLNFKIGSWNVNASQPVSVSSIKLNKTSLKLKNGSAYTLKKTIAPSNAGSKSVTWSSSNKKIAAVSASGKITAKGVGKATITVKTSNGKKAACRVTVRPKTNKIKKLKKSGRKNIKITWSKVSGTTKYQIYMSKKKSSGYKRIKTASSKTTSFTKKGLKRGKRYYFKVRSYKTVGKIKYYSSFSGVKSLKR
ncbi:GH25 family lysozyme [Anaerostipes sp.]|uniref:GH25 family lysozyme n=1 Tax=Anaerostipes sp. TaxID=1872530 RepID=UPI0025C16030|nr:GH25 family lysozyme [Anaerostipes sp.]MBS7007909.1 Ig-like domain-containing protein [Anaerostipes sp.]